MNVAASAVGIAVCLFYFYLLDELISVKHLPHLLYVVPTVFSIITAGLVIRARRWMVDINRFIELKLTNREPDPKLTRTAQRKVLNMPFFAGINTITGWGLGAFFISGYRLFFPLPMDPFSVTLIQSIMIFIGIMTAGVITMGVVFLATEITCQNVWPYFFPHGGLVNTPGAFRPKLRSRLMANFVLTSFLPLVLMAVLSYNKVRMILVVDPSQVISSLFNLTAVLLLTTLLVAFILSHMLTHTIVDPVIELEEAMARVEQGDWNASVTVASNDELGLLADRFNRMTQGLIEKEKLRRSLEVAQEVQQSLIPKEDPDIPGFDIAGSTHYCDETGGDYYDFLYSGDQGEICLVVGDVSGHGIPSALLMASVRASFRQRSATPGSLARIVSDVNRQLSLDVDESGRFMTLFCCRIHPEKETLTWVSAGHDPGLVYCPQSDSFTELPGANPALGLVPNHQYQENTRTVEPGRIVVIGTDGIWEAHSPEGEPFGKKRLRNLIRAQHRNPAREIVHSIVEAVGAHRHPLGREDDVTVVVARMGERVNG